MRTLMLRRPGTLRLWCSLRRSTIQEVVLVLLFLAVLRSLRVIAAHFHTFFGVQLRKVADEQHQLPAVIAAAVDAERRHAGKAYAMLDDPKNLAIGKFLRIRLAQIRRLRIHPASQHGPPVAVIS